MKSKLSILFISFLICGCSINPNRFNDNSNNLSTNNVSTGLENLSSSSTSSSFFNSSSSTFVNSSTSSTSEQLADPYADVTYEEFYKNYKEATSYIDAMYRTQHGFMSGSIEECNQYPIKNTIYDGDDFVRFSNTNFQYDENGNIISFDINTKEGKYKTIYYNAAYITLEEVAAYILAFNEVPPNSNYDKNDKDESISDWGQFGRVNIGNYSNNVSKYPYEPELPTKDSNGKTYSYIETDIGLLVGFTMSNDSYVDIYNDGNSIARGVCRIVFTSSYSDGTKINDINERHVFYTYNHYNDFEEYLNYYGGWGNRFGNETSGNPYCGGKNDFYNLINPNTPTSYVSAKIIDKNIF